MATNKKIKQLMKENNHKKYQLAELLGITKQTIAKKLSNKSIWKNKELEKLAKIYNKDIEYFY